MYYGLMVGGGMMRHIKGVNIYVLDHWGSLKLNKETIMEGYTLLYKLYYKL